MANILNFLLITGEGSGFDYTISTTLVRALFRSPSPPDEIRFIFRMDGIAQEDNETLMLELIPAAPIPTGFFRNFVNLIIVDSDGIIIK